MLLKRLMWLLVFVIFGAIAVDYVKKNDVSLDDKIDEVINFLEETTTEQMAAVTKEPLNSEIVPVDSALQKEPSDLVSTAEEIASAVLYYATRYEERFTIEFKGDTAQLESLIQQAYTILEQQDPYIYGHLSDRNIEFSYTSRRATLNFYQQYLTNYEQERLVNGKVQAILKTVDTNKMTDYDKVKFVNDYIVQHTVYSEATVASPHSAYAVLYEGKGVCQGYALLAYKMLDEMGVKNLYITGEVPDGGHAWNMVKLDGHWYHLDTTWNDPLPDRGLGVSYNYFLISDSQLQKDHAWDIAKYPRAESTYSF